MAIHVHKRTHLPTRRRSVQPATPEPPEALPAFDRDYWIAHSDGYDVSDGNHRLGFVEETLADRDDPGHRLLVIRSGVLGRHLYAARAEDVVTIVPRAQRIWLRTGAPLTELKDATAALPRH